jgi:hypothetical protein
VAIPSSKHDDSEAEMMNHVFLHIQTQSTGDQEAKVNLA